MKLGDARVRKKGDEGDDDQVIESEHLISSRSGRNGLSLSSFDGASDDLATHKHKCKLDDVTIE